MRDSTQCSKTGRRDVKIDFVEFLLNPKSITFLYKGSKIKNQNPAKNTLYTKD